jgi:hypothetical protein
MSAPLPGCRNSGPKQSFDLVPIPGEEGGQYRDHAHRLDARGRLSLQAWPIPQKVDEGEKVHHITRILLSSKEKFINKDGLYRANQFTRYGPILSVQFADARAALNQGEQSPAMNQGQQVHFMGDFLAINNMPTCYQSAGSLN